MRALLPAFLTSSVAFVSGCGAMYNSSLEKDLRKRASFDMECSPKKLELTELSSTNGMITTYGVRGCGSKATYVLNPGNGAWVLNTDSEPDK